MQSDCHLYPPSAVSPPSPTTAVSPPEATGSHSAAAGSRVVPHLNKGGGALNYAMTSVNREWTLHFSLLSCLTKTKKIMELSSDQVEKFHRDGYLIIENFMSPAECDRLRQRAYQIIAEEDLSAHPLVTFNTTDMKQVRTDYFITSGDKIRFFFEDGAVGENGKLKVCVRCM